MSRRFLFREVILLSEKLTTLSQLRAVSQKSKDRAAQVADTAAAALDEMDGVKADKTEFVSFSIPATGWKTDSSVPGYTNYIDIAISGLTAADYVAVDVAPSSSAVARAANFVATESRAGILRLRAASVPTATISAQYHIITAATAARRVNLMAWGPFNAGGGGGSSGGTAADISYDNSKSGISAANVQEAIDALSVLTLTIQAVPAQSGA